MYRPNTKTERLAPNVALLKVALEAAVPIWMFDLQRRCTLAEIQARAGECGQIVAEKGDVLQFGGGKKGEAGKAFNALAEGLACLAFCPGGVTFCGLHFEATYQRKESP